MDAESDAMGLETIASWQLAGAATGVSLIGHLLVAAGAILSQLGTSRIAGADTGGRSGALSLVSPSNLIILALGGAAALSAHLYDGEVARDSRSAEHEEGVGEAGDGGNECWTQAGMAVGSCLMGIALNSQKAADVGEDLACALVVNGLLTAAIKAVSNRTRPDGAAWSFPSGHTSAAFATALVLERHFGWKAGMPALAVAAYVGGSRLQESRHFLSDVVFGAALGVVSGRSRVANGRGCSPG